MENLDSKKVQLKMKLLLINFLSSPSNKITKLELESNLKELPTDSLGWKNYEKGSTTISFTVINDDNTTIKK